MGGNQRRAEPLCSKQQMVTQHPPHNAILFLYNMSYYDNAFVWFYTVGELPVLQIRAQVPVALTAFRKTYL